MKLTNENIAAFIYNSNAIEGLHTPYKDIFEILEGTKHGQSPLILNQIAAVEYIKENRKEVPTISMVMQLHRILMTNIDRYAGVIRPFDVWIGGEVAPDPRKVQYMLQTWCGMWGKKPVDTWTNKKAALYRHYEYEVVHPFPDGNGRSGRLLYLWDCLHHRTKMDIIKFDTRIEYYKSIQKYRSDQRDVHITNWR